jgi:hypothetical protein
MDLEKTEIQTVLVKSISLTFRSATVSENMSTVDLQKTNTVEDERSQFYAIDRQHSRDHCRSSIEKRQMFSRGDQQVTFTYFQLTRLSKSSRQWI